MTEILKQVTVEDGVGLYPIKDEEYEVIVEENEKKNDSLQRVANEKRDSVIVPYNELLRQMKDNSNLFWKLEEKHGRYFIEELYKHKPMILGTFAIMKTGDLKELVRYPNYYFVNLVRAELAERKAKARLLKARGRLRRKKVQACLV